MSEELIQIAAVRLFVSFRLPTLCSTHKHCAGPIEALFLSHIAHITAKNKNGDSSCFD